MAEKAIITETYKKSYLSALTDKDDRGEATGLTMEPTPFAATREIVGCQRDSVKGSAPRYASAWVKHVKNKRIKGDNQHDTSGLKSDSLKGLGQGTGMLNKRLFGLGQAQMDFFRQNRSIGVGLTYLNDHKGRSLSDPHRGSGPPLHKNLNGLWAGSSKA